MRVRLGEDDTLHHPDPTRAAEALAALIRACRRRLWLRVPALDALTADPAVLDALKALALSSPQADLRVLFDDVDQAVKRGHGLVHLARRLPSRLHLRQTQPDDADPALCFAVAERTESSVKLAFQLAQVSMTALLKPMRWDLSMLLWLPILE